MKLEFYTITINDKCFDLPKDMPIPQIGSIIFIEGETALVKKIRYHIVDGKLFMISIVGSDL